MDVIDQSASSPTTSDLSIQTLAGVVDPVPFLPTVVVDVLAMWSMWSMPIL